MKRLLSLFAFLLGEAVIIVSFLLWGGGTATDILALNMVVCSLIYCLFFVDVLVPWVNWSDKAQKSIGSMGVRWFITWVYAALAVAVMLVCNLWLVTSFELQLILHCVLFFLLLLGFTGVLHASGKVAERYVQESQCRQGVQEMKQAVRGLKDAAEGCAQLPASCMRRINDLEDGLRYLSPSDNWEARSLERQFVETVESIAIALPGYAADQEKVDAAFKKAERLYANRKSLYSN